MSKEEPIIFSSGELKLEGLLARPAKPNARAAIVCHPHPQYGGSMHNNVVEAALDAMWKLGFATLRFNFRGVGRSEGEYEGGRGEADDARAAMSFLMAQRDVAQEHAVVAGYSFGAAIAMHAAVGIANADTICAIALPVGMGSFEDAPAGRRIVLVAGDSDDYCPRKSIEELARKFGDRAALRIIEGADHFLVGYENELSAGLVELLSLK